MQRLFIYMCCFDFPSFWENYVLKPADSSHVLLSSNLKGFFNLTENNV